LLLSVWSLCFARLVTFLCLSLVFVMSWASLFFFLLTFFLWISFRVVCCQCTHQGGDWGPGASRWSMDDRQTLHKCPCVGCIASSWVRGSRVIYHTGGTRYISHECVWMALSLRDLGFHPPLPFLFFPRHFLLHFLFRLAWELHERFVERDGC
jgi:hypothetical protein